LCGEMAYSALYWDLCGEMAYSALYWDLSVIGDTVFCKESRRYVGEILR